jgi:L-rhamnose mutarotase
MIRRAFTLRLKPGALAEYKKYHENVWPELVEEIERSGIARMTAFEADPVIFYYSEILDEGAWDRLWHTEVHDRWGELFKSVIAFNDEGIVEAGDLREIFHLETKAGEATG